MAPSSSPQTEERPTNEAGTAPATAVENNGVPDSSDDPTKAFQNARRVSVVDQTCCNGFATKSKICVIQ